MSWTLKLVEYLFVFAFTPFDSWAVGLHPSVRSVVSSPEVRGKHINISC